MATINKRGNTFQIVVSLGLDVNGKKIRKTTTYKPPENTTPKKAEKLAQEFAVEFERKCRGLSSLNENMRFSSTEETFRLGDKLKNQLEADFTARFGGRFFCAMPDGRYVYQRRGRDYLLEGSSASPEAVMKASLEQGENLLVTIFTAVDLYPDPDAVY